jgi:hypothetical protein
MSSLLELGVGYDARMFKDLAERQCRKPITEKPILNYREQPADDFSELLGVLAFLDLLDLFL